MKKVLLIISVALINIVVAQQKELTLEDAILKQRSVLAPKSLRNVNWIPNTNAFSYMSDDMQTLLKQTSSDKTPVTIISLSSLNKILKSDDPIRHFYGLRWVDKDNFIINAGTKYYTYNITSKKANLVAELHEGDENIDIHLGSKNIAYTHGKSLYVYVKNTSKSVTRRSHEEIVVGQAIARFEFGISKGTFWSPSGNQLAFYEKDEMEVSNYPLVDLNSTPANLNNIKYPMAGQKSEIPKVGIYNVSSQKVVYLKTTGKKYDYLTNLSWSLDGKYVIVAELNRAQNHMKLNKFDANTGKFVKTLFEEKNDKWVEPEHPAYFLSNNEFIWMSERDGYMNLYKYDLEGNLLKQITKNKWVASSILGLDKSKKNLIYTGTGSSPLEAHAFSVNLKNGKQRKITTNKGVHNVKMNSTGSLFVDSYSSTTVPRKINVIDGKGNIKRNILTAKNPLKDYAISTPEISTIKSADGKTDLYTRIIKPTNFNPNIKYPVLVYVYGGPHAQLITDSWLAGAAMWMYYQAERGYIIYTIDNRGSKGRGFEFESVIHRNLGENEMQDQLKGIEYLKSLPYVNKNRIAVHGWSFGGFMTTSLMLKHPGVFNVGVAGGPVTDWSYYEVMYGERYMDTPEENKEGYKKTRLHNYTSNLKGELLLIHGTGDDVVVPQHNYSLIKSFVDDGIQVDFFPYPMHPHNVRGKDRVHLMKKVLTYIEKNNRGKRDKRNRYKNNSKIPVDKLLNHGKGTNSNGTKIKNVDLKDVEKKK